MSTFLIAGPINYRRVRELSEFLHNLKSPRATIVISSHGGDEGCGRALAGMILATRKRNNTLVTTVGYGDIQSAAVLVFAAGTTRLLSKYATVMVHESSTSIDGNASTMKKAAKQMESDEKFWCDIMHELTGTDSKTWLKLHADETYLRPEEALALNLATELI